MSKEVTEKAEGDQTAGDGQAGDASVSGGDAGGDKSTAAATTELTEEQRRVVDSVVSKMHDRIKAEYEAKAEAERKRAEEERLKTQGEFQKLFEERDTELRALKAQQAADAFRADALESLTQLGMAEFADIVTPGAQTLDEVRTRADKLKAALAAKVDAEVSGRLGTGQHPTSTNTAPADKPIAKMSVAEKAAFISEHGRDKFESRLAAEKTKASKT